MKNEVAVERSWCWRQKVSYTQGKQVQLDTKIGVTWNSGLEIVLYSEPSLLRIGLHLFLSF